MEQDTRTPWKHRLMHAAILGTLTGTIGALIQPGASWLGIPVGLASGLLWFALEPLIKPRRPLRDPVREESVAATEAAIRLAEAEIICESDRSD